MDSAVVRSKVTEKKLRLTVERKKTCGGEREGRLNRFTSTLQLSNSIQGVNHCQGRIEGIKWRHKKLVMKVRDVFEGHNVKS